MSLADILEKERRWKKYSRKKMAEFLGISSGYYSQLINGSRKGNNLIEQFSKKLGRPIDDFYANGREAPIERSEPAMLERIRDLREARDSIGNSIMSKEIRMRNYKKKLMI